MAWMWFRNLRIALRNEKCSIGLWSLKPLGLLCQKSPYQNWMFFTIRNSCIKCTSFLLWAQGTWIWAFDHLVFLSQDLSKCGLFLQQPSSTVYTLFWLIAQQLRKAENGFKRRRWFWFLSHFLIRCFLNSVLNRKDLHKEVIEFYQFP